MVFYSEVLASVGEAWRPRVYSADLQHAQMENNAVVFITVYTPSIRDADVPSAPLSLHQSNGQGWTK